MTILARRPPDALVQVVADAWTESFWDAARDGRLTCARCGTCGRFRMPPSPFCPNCRSQAIDWPTLPGTGTIYTYTIVERAVLPGTEDSIPYVVAVVTLDGAEGARLIANVVDAPLDRIRIGARVRAGFEPAGGAVMPRFVLEEP